MPPPWQPYREPLRVTLLRTGAIALAIGAALTLARGRPGLWPMGSLLALWPALGGHYVELWFLNWLRPRIPAARATQVAARLIVWFVGGAVLALGMFATAKALDWPLVMGDWTAWWWLAGVGFIGVELIAHLALLLFRRPSFYDGRG